MNSIRNLQTCNNTMYTGAAQDDVTTAMVNEFNVEYYAFLTVYTLICGTLIMAPHLFMVNFHEPSTVK